MRGVHKMPDYGLSRNNPAPQQQPPSQTPPPMNQLQTMSDMAKLSTENALLREALATSAQNSEALTQKLVESQTEFQQAMKAEIVALQQSQAAMNNTTKRQLEEMQAMIIQTAQSHQKEITQQNQHMQSRLNQIKNTSESFSQSINAALVTVGDKLVASVTEGTKKALNENADTMLAIIENTKIASNALTDSVTDFTKKINDIFKVSKTKLDGRVTRFNNSVQNMFNIDSKEKWLFYLGVFGGIATPIMLFAVMLFHIIGN